MKIYITDLEAYNRGCSIRAWIKFPISEDEVSETIKNVLFEGQKACNDNYCHEDVITNYEAGFEIGEYDNIYVLNEIAEALENYNEDELLKFRFLVSSGHSERDIVENGLENNGYWKN